MSLLRLRELRMRADRFCSLTVRQSWLYERLSEMKCSWRYCVCTRASHHGGLGLYGGSGPVERVWRDSGLHASLVRTVTASTYLLVQPRPSALRVLSQRQFARRLLGLTYCCSLPCSPLMPWSTVSLYTNQAVQRCTPHDHDMYPSQRVRACLPVWMRTGLFARKARTAIFLQLNRSSRLVVGVRYVFMVSPEPFLRLIIFYHSSLVGSPTE